MVQMVKDLSAVETFRWRDGRLQTVDQRVLPVRFEYLSCVSAAEVAEGIGSRALKRMRGARESDE